MFSEFIKDRKQGLQLIAALFLGMLAYKFGMPDSYQASKFRLMADLWLLVGAPGAVLWEINEFRKKR